MPFERLGPARVSPDDAERWLTGTLKEALELQKPGLAR
jgi:hypothetical protein